MAVSPDAPEVCFSPEATVCQPWGKQINKNLLGEFHLFIPPSFLCRRRTREDHWHQFNPQTFRSQTKNKPGGHEGDPRFLTPFHPRRRPKNMMRGTQASSEGDRGPLKQLSCWESRSSKGPSHASPSPLGELQGGRLGRTPLLPQNPRVLLRRGTPLLLRLIFFPQTTVAAGPPRA